MDIARGGHQSCVIDSMIYVFCGINSSIVYVDSADAYNTKTDEWSNLTPTLIDLYESNAEVVNDTIYLVGGWKMDFNTSKSVMAYDPGGNSWVYKKDCPINTGANTSCVLNDTLYILGGVEYPDSPDQKKALYYVPGTDNWSSAPDMIYDHGVGASACVYDNKIFVFGGIGHNFFIHGKSEMYDPIKKSWKEIAEMPVPVLNHISVVHDDKFYIFGGDSGSYSHVRSYSTNTIQEYDPSTDKWRLMEGMPFKRANMTGQKVGDSVYLFGGYQNDSRDFTNPLSEVWRFNLDSLEVATVVNPIKVTQKDRISLFPNPTNHLLTIKSDQPDFKSIEIISLSGQLIYRTEMEGATRQIDITQFRKGVYFVTVRSKEFVRTEKIIKL